MATQRAVDLTPTAPVTRKSADLLDNSCPRFKLRDIFQTKFVLEDYFCARNTT